MTVGGTLHRAMRHAITAYSIRNRHAKAARISAWMEAHGVRTVLMVGVVARGHGDANVGIVEDAVMGGRDVLLGINIDRQPVPYPFTVADARRMPLRDDSVDFALANAIIEHVGDEPDQRQFVAEHCRVARSWAITTPNKWFPVESHTAAVFLHWLPAWRRRRTEFTRLLSLREFRAILPPTSQVHGRPWSPTFTAMWSSDASRRTGVASD